MVHCTIARGTSTGVRIFKTKWLVRFARRHRIADRSLVEAIARAGQGLIDANLGGGLIKQRVARLGQGRSGGHRMIIAFRTNERAVFLYGFAKNERDNIDADESQTLGEIGAAWLQATPEKLAYALADNSLQEITDGDEGTKPVDEGLVRDSR